MWIWQLIIRRAKKVTIPLTDKNPTPEITKLLHTLIEIFQIFCSPRVSATSSERYDYLAPSVPGL
jgi:hypothetical protein